MIILYILGAIGLLSPLFVIAFLPWGIDIMKGQPNKTEKEQPIVRFIEKRK